MNEIRRKYYIPRVRQLLKRIRRNCPKCMLLTAAPEPPEMGSIPRARLSPFTPAFSYTGVDCMGPLEVIVGRRREKRWIVLFTCFTFGNCSWNGPRFIHNGIAEFHAKKR